MTEKKVFCSAAESRVKLTKQCGNLIGSLFVHTVCDSNYYCHTLIDALQIIGEANIYTLCYVDEISDCDDFQKKLANVFLERSYAEIDGKVARRPPSLFGIASSWDHAFNVMINADGLVRFVEPQTSEIYLPHELPTGIVQVEW